MNTDSVPYSEQLNGNRPGEFAAMWRHVHDIFTKSGATNATWVWCPNVEYDGSTKPLAALYPGDAYVDWTCMDGYNWGANPVRPSGWQAPAQVFQPTYDLITKSIAPSKPVMIGETASTEVGGSKSRWIGDLLRLPGGSEFPQVRAVVWFNKRWDRMDWPIETSQAARSAFARGIGDRRFAGNGFRRLKTSPIGSP
jgi:beta-mannanase